MSANLIGSSFADTVAWSLPHHSYHKACKLYMYNNRTMDKVRGSSVTSVNSCQRTGGPSTTGDLGRGKGVNQVGSKRSGWKQS